MAKRIHIRHLIILLLLAGLACNNINTEVFNTDQDATSNIFCIGYGPNSKEVIKQLIDVSGLKREGYVAILPSHFGESDSTVYYLKHEFREQQVNAIHSLDLKPGREIKNTDLLAIENAALICITDGPKQDLMRFSKDTIIRRAILKAFNNGTTIAGYGAAAPLMGEKLLVENENIRYQQEDGDKTNSRYRLVEGLGLIKNTILINQDFSQKNHQEIENNIQNSPETLLIIYPLTTLSIIENHATVTGNSQVELIELCNTDTSSKQKTTIYSAGDHFNLN